MIFFTILCVLLIICFIYYYHNKPIKENLATSPDTVTSSDIVNQQSDYIDTNYLNNYSKNLSELTTKCNDLRSSLNQKRLGDFMTFDCKYKEPPSTELIGVQSSSEMFSVDVSSNGPLSNIITIEVPVGKKGAPGPQGDMGEKGETGDVGPVGETGNCGNVLIQ